MNQNPITIESDGLWQGSAVKAADGKLIENVVGVTVDITDPGRPVKACVYYDLPGIAITTGNWHEGRADWRTRLLLLRWALKGRR